MNVSLAAAVRRLSAEAAADTSDPGTREVLKRTGGVPVYQDMGGVLIVTPSGQVLAYDPESGAVVEPEPRWERLALVRAARRFPELEGLMPERPETSVECHACGGSGAKMGLPCGVCFGTGWTLP